MTLPFVRELLISLARQTPVGRAAEALSLRTAAVGGRVRISGLTPSAQLLAVAQLQRLTRRPVLLIVPDNRVAEEWRDTLATFADLTGSEAEAERPLVLPGFEVDPYEGLSPHPAILEQRALALWRGAEGTPFLIVPAVAAATKIASSDTYRRSVRRLRRGDFLDLEGCAEQLVAMGYERQEPVEMPGQFSIRGGLLDVYSPEAPRPVRLELFGDEIESLREFDPATQRSVASAIAEILLVPLTSIPLSAELRRRLATPASGRAEDPAGAEIAPGWEFRVPGLEGFQHTVFDLAAHPLVIVSEPEAVRAELERWWRRLEQHHAEAAWRRPEQSGRPLGPKPQAAWEPQEMLGPKPQAAWGPQEMLPASQARGQAANTGVPSAPARWGGSGSDQAKSGEPPAALAGAEGTEAMVPAPPPETIFYRPEEMEARLASHAVVELRELALHEVDLNAETLELQASAAIHATRGLESPPAAPPALRLEYASRPSTRYQGAVAHLMDDVRRQLSQGQRLLFLGANTGEVERLGDLFTEYNLPFQFGSRPERSGSDYLSEKAYFSPATPAAIIAQGPLLRGFTLPVQKITILGSNDLFQADEAPVHATPARRSNTSSFLSDFRDLAPGDFVVHVEHGIGRYVGLKSFEGGPASSAAAAGHGLGEFMILEYAEGAKLYVPLTRMDLVQKYRSAEGAPPALDRMGGTQWAQRKSRVKRAMKDMADELLKLYAARQAVRVPACSPDDNTQREFEDAFPYVETEDQQKAIRDVRQDLESARPMDRLVIGDVGYGKTEVAMRAAFKVVGDGRQVAILAPTTVLAFQHEQTFKQRFRAFPVTIDMLSRFRTRAQQKETVERIGSGKVDIVIGTHRLLSKDVQFQNLGLLVVDEEQRFGVRHKERLKQLKKEVHVLAMSATPIPRSLNMSLAGLRDMSVIETPPRDRLAIQTVVAGWNESLIAAAIEQELERGGQAYFVHNRVDSIWDIAALIQRLVPRARIAVGHGQMGEDELEKVMLRFVRHEADVLLSTTIIENGLDIPLANTMIINRADRLGLSELYQLRGRVGRSNRRAYAYLLVPAEAELPPLARKRLAAMREFSDLGAGFKIAALDLELRGAGNMLGGEQSGNLDAVGFDLYVQMLEQTVRELKGEAPEMDSEVQLHMGLDIRIPAEYVPEENQRLRMYKRLAGVETEAERADVLRELKDRYGPPPAPVQNLLAYAALKPLCRGLGLHSLERRRDHLWLRFSPHSKVDPNRITALIERTRGAQFSPDGVLKLPFTVNGAAAVLAETERLLTEVAPVGTLVS